jgi:hypothetical protein
VPPRPSATIAGMKPQFQIKTILLVTAIVAIACGGILADEGINGYGRGHPLSFKRITATFLLGIPKWIPVVFVAFMLGRRLTVTTVVLFAIAEALSVGVEYLTLNWMFG